jgi:uncharacterized membrane protein YozB (DUF420 family)
MLSSKLADIIRHEINKLRVPNLTTLNIVMNVKMFVLHGLFFLHSPNERVHRKFLLNTM